MNERHDLIYRIVEEFKYGTLARVILAKGETYKWLQENLWAHLPAGLGVELIEEPRLVYTDMYVLEPEIYHLLKSDISQAPSTDVEYREPPDPKTRLGVVRRWL